MQELPIAIGYVASMRCVDFFDYSMHEGPFWPGVMFANLSFELGQRTQGTTFYVPWVSRSLLKIGMGKGI